MSKRTNKRRGAPGRPGSADAKTAARFAVRVQPGASADRLIGRIGDEWKITLTARPIEGQANRSCTNFIAKLLDVPRSTVTIVQGETSRRKLLQVDGMLQMDLESKLDHAAR